MRIGTALHCEIRPSIFHRKNYFYPDMPKDYQISQYDEPINVDGWLELPDGDRVGIERAHMEEDTGKTTHVGGGGRIHDADHSLVDYNRAGVPLVEIVSAPDIRSADQARPTSPSCGRSSSPPARPTAGWRRARCASTPTCRSRPAGTDEFGTRCEIKNLNSLRSLGRAIEYEAARQIALLESAATRSSRRPATGTRTAGRTVADALQGGGLRLPLLPRARPRAGRARPRPGSRRSPVDRPTPGRPPGRR